MCVSVASRPHLVRGGHNSRELALIRVAARERCFKSGKMSKLKVSANDSAKVSLLAGRVLESRGGTLARRTNNPVSAE